MVRFGIQVMSGRKRFFVDGIQSDNTARIEGDEFVHAKTVQRIKGGAEITLLDGSGKEYTAIVAKVEKHALVAHITGVYDGDREPHTAMYLLCGALKGDKTELVVQKACELGVQKIGIFASEYCAAYMNANKLERLNKVAREATKQCMRSRAPEVVFFDNFKSALDSAGEYENKLFACEFAEGSGADIMSLCGSTAMVVGSEGGFSQNEFELSKQLNFAPITLGKRILRAETAAISLLSVVAYAIGELR